jgi:hypothetical protein
MKLDLCSICLRSGRSTCTNESHNWHDEAESAEIPEFGGDGFESVCRVQFEGLLVVLRHLFRLLAVLAGVQSDTVTAMRAFSSRWGGMPAAVSLSRQPVGCSDPGAESLADAN